MSQLKVNTIRHTGASSDAVTLASDGTCTAKITNNLSNRNLIINGAMNVAQRGTSSTASGYNTVDRFRDGSSGNDEAPTYEQADVASGTTPFQLGFRKCLKITNGNQTNGAGVSDRVRFEYRIEAQDIANSGWNYTSASSYITLSFWVKSSVAQNFYARIYSADGTPQAYSFETGALSADTWTKVTKKIPGNSNLQFDNNTDYGVIMSFAQYAGSDYTDAGNTMNTWAAYTGTNRYPTNTSTWYTTNDATWEFTGMQLEVGDVATDFEHRSYSDELLRCQRYCMKWEGQNTGGNHYRFPMGQITGSTTGSFPISHSVPMRAVESRAISHGIATTSTQAGGGGNQSGPTMTLDVGGCGTMSSFVNITNLDSGQTGGNFWATRVGSDNDWWLIVENEL